MRAPLPALLRSRFELFLIKVFEELHPGEPPLQLEWYVKAIAHALTQAASGRRARLVITVPPRHLKSIAAAVALPAFLLGHNPATKIMVASYSQDLARQHAEQCRRIMESDWYKALFPTRISERGNRQLELITTAGGMRKAVSVGGSVTGFGCDVLIVDDCMKAEDANSQAVRDMLIAWYEGTLMTRLNDKATGVVISIQQRLHEYDLPAYLLEKGYEHLNLPSIAVKSEIVPIGGGQVHRRTVGDLLSPLRQPREVLDQIRRDVGPAVFEAQQQQSPGAPDGNIIRLDWFREYTGKPGRSYFTKVVQSWDPASTVSKDSDWSVCLTWGNRENIWFLVDVYRERVEYPDLKRAVLKLKREWTPDRILIERASAGLPLVQELRLEGHRDIFSPKPKGDKQTRMIAQTAELESGRFVLPVEALWLDRFRNELRMFPNGRHDDQVDALSQFVEFQKVKHRWVEEERARDGRLLRPVRSRFRSV